MPAQYTVGQSLGDCTVTSSTYTENPDGSSLEEVVLSNGGSFATFTPDPVTLANQQAIEAANANLQALVAQMAPSLAQAQTDLATLAASTDALAPILARTVQGVVTLAQGLADALVALEVIAASEIKQGN